MAISAANLAIATALTDMARQQIASRTYLTTQRAKMVQPTCEAHVGLAVIGHFASFIPLFQQWAATPGLEAFAGNQDNLAMIAAFTAVRDELMTMFPKDVNGWLLYQSLDAQGRIQMRTFTAAQLAPAVVLIDSAIAQIP